MKELIYRGRLIRRVGFYGIGRSNLGVFEYLRAHFPSLTYVFRTDTEAGGEARALMQFGEVLTGALAAMDFDEDVIFTTPALRRLGRSFGDAMLSSDAELFFELAKIPVLAISGSDGKSTSAALCAEILRAAGKRAEAIGNIGVAMTPMLDSRLDVAVVELSSFQLMNFSPSVDGALITNITPNHLNWHESFTEYVGAKENLLFGAKRRVFNYDCPEARRLAVRHGAFAVFSASLSCDELRGRIDAENYLSAKDGVIFLNGAEFLDTGATQMQKRHDALNLCGAIALTRGFAERADVMRAAKSFRPLCHRCEFIGEFGGVEYYDASIDSTPKRSATTLEGFSGRVNVIIGGRSKGLDYGALLPTLKEKALRITLTGETGALLMKILDDEALSDLEYEYIADFDEAVRFAASRAGRGERVVLSPASTSFDRFKNFEERGERFKRIISDYYKG